MTEDSNVVKLPSRREVTVRKTDVKDRVGTASDSLRHMAAEDYPLEGYLLVRISSQGYDLVVGGQIDTLSTIGALEHAKMRVLGGVLEDDLEILE